MRYLIGIDLGTTNSCVSYIDTLEPQMPLHVFKIPQIVSPGSIEDLATLPSFCYLAGEDEWEKSALNLPWKVQSGFFVGSFAKKQGANVPTRLVQSAKSWLCHSSSNRRERILPIEAAEESSRVSPVEATARYLEHIRSAWNSYIAKGVLENEFDAQDVVLTVPASFDEVARSLTIEAARLAGFSNMTLLEEPQAAFYSWIAQHEKKWESLLKEDSCILVCDVGGGTTDFSLIEVVSTDGKLAFQRMAVGDHLLLGGDNMDVTVARYIEEKLETKGYVLSRSQHLQLRHEARQAKEFLLNSEDCGNVYKVILHGAGSGVVQGTITAEVNGKEIRELLLTGFFGIYSWQDALNIRKNMGLRTMGLPYENEPSITKHLAHFLQQNGEGEKVRQPDAVLFNGGTMKPQIFQEAVLDSLRHWFPEKIISSLSSYNLDLAVARGAAYYGKARHGFAVKIGGGSARGYYLSLDVKEQDGSVIKKALTLLPRGSEEGASYEPEQVFRLKPNTPVSFQLCTSHVRLHDVSGDIIDIDPLEIHSLPPIHTILRLGKGTDSQLSQNDIPVHLYAHLTPVGTLEINLKSLNTQHVWDLEFQLRGSGGKENSLATLAPQISDETFQVGYLNEAEAFIQNAFTSPYGEQNLDKVMENLEEILKIPRREWPLSVMRGLGDAVIKSEASGKIKAATAVRWWNLTGFLLRPGYGYALDDFRLREMWKIILSNSKAILPPEVQLQTWICYRRIAGGMTKGQQMQLINALLGSFFNKKEGSIEIKNKKEIYSYSEKIRAAAAMELIDMALKIKLGNALVSRICAGEGIAADFWALGRIGARHLLYGSLAYVVPREICEKWVLKLIQSRLPADEKLSFLIGQLARKTEHREINVSADLANKALLRFSEGAHQERLSDLLLKENFLTQGEQEQIFGDKLPAGLLLELDIASTSR